MKPFAYADASTIEEAVQALERDCRPLAGGTDLIALMKKGLVTPGRVVNLKTIPDLHDVRRDEGGWHIGALTTLSALADRDRGALHRELPLLAQAARESASPQLRHAATLGGNLLQRPRCWYFRNPLTHCWLKGGDHCFAAVGKNAYHAILGAGTCHMVHPSDPAVALVALDAQVEIAGPEGCRRIPVADLFAEPKQGGMSETILAADELITVVLIPSPPKASHGVYVKVAERAVWDFALVSAAVEITLSEGVVADVSVVLGGVASGPWRARSAEEALSGRPLVEETIEEAAAASSAGAVPLPDSGYKIPLVEGALREALRRLSRALGGR